MVVGKFQLLPPVLWKSFGPPPSRFSAEAELSAMLKYNIKLIEKRFMAIRFEEALEVIENNLNDRNFRCGKLDHLLGNKYILCASCTCWTYIYLIDNLHFLKKEKKQKKEKYVIVLTKYEVVRSQNELFNNV